MTRVVVWIVEETWQATVAAAAAFLPTDADITLLHVRAGDAQAVARGARDALLGRSRRPAAEPLDAICGQGARELLARDHDHAHRGPRSLGPAARYVVDHAPCAVLLIWPDTSSG